MKLLANIRMRFVVWVWNHTPTCAEMARLASESLDKPVTFGQWWRMKLHWVICAWCERYQKHLKFLHQAAPRYDEAVGEVSPRTLSREARHRLKQRLQSERAR